MEWSGRHSTPTGIEERLRPRRLAEEAQLPPRGKRVSAAQWNELVSFSLTELDLFVFLYDFFNYVQPLLGKEPKEITPAMTAFKLEIIALYLHQCYQLYLLHE